MTEGLKWGKKREMEQVSWNQIYSLCPWKERWSERLQYPAKWGSWWTRKLFFSVITVSSPWYVLQLVIFFLFLSLKHTLTLLFLLHTHTHTPQPFFSLVTKLILDQINFQSQQRAWESSPQFRTCIKTQLISWMLAIGTTLSCSFLIELTVPFPVPRYE